MTCISRHYFSIHIYVLKLYTGSLGLNLLDPVSCRGLFALFALSFDIVSPEASRHRRLTFRFAPGRHARIQHTFIVICGVDRWTTRRTTDPPGCARRPCVCDENWTVAPPACAQSIDFGVDGYFTFRPGSVSARKYSPVLRTLAYAVLFLTKRYA